jgi:hypothetical protein
MAKPYSMDLRERAMRHVAAGESARSVAAVLKVSVSSVIKATCLFALLPLVAMNPFGLPPLGGRPPVRAPRPGKLPVGPPKLVNSLGHLWHRLDARQTGWL